MGQFLCKGIRTGLLKLRFPHFKMKDTLSIFITE